MRRQTSVFSLICTAWVVLSGAFGQQAQMSAASDEVPMPPMLVRLILPTEPTAKLSHKPSQWRFMHGETDHLTNREVFDKKSWIARGIFLDSIIYDAELTRQGLAHHRCVAGHINLGSIHRGRRSMVIICWNSPTPHIHATGTWQIGVEGPGL
jgi:hypothetical protein